MTRPELLKLSLIAGKYEQQRKKKTILFVSLLRGATELLLTFAIDLLFGFCIEIICHH